MKGGETGSYRERYPAPLMTCLPFSSGSQARREGTVGAPLAHQGLSSGSPQGREPHTWLGAREQLVPGRDAVSWAQSEAALCPWRGGVRWALFLGRFLEREPSRTEHGRPQAPGAILLDSSGLPERSMMVQGTGTGLSILWLLPTVQLDIAHPPPRRGIRA